MFKARILLLAVTLALPGCGSLTRLDQSHGGVYLVQTDGSFLNGGVTACGLIADQEIGIEIQTLEFDAETNKCAATVISKRIIE